MSDALPRAVAIVGPTAAGKGALGREVAKRLALPILVCDSVKVYRGLDIGSGKPTSSMRASWPHRLIDLVDPSEDFSAGDYADAAWTELRDGGGVFVGGTGFYLRTVAWTPSTPRECSHDGPTSDPLRVAFHTHWNAVEAEHPGAIWHALRERDAATAAEIHPANRVRCLRALWLCECLGTPLSELRARERPELRLRLCLIMLDPGPERLAERIEQRVDAMMLGTRWIDEVEQLRVAGYHAGHKAMQSLGYRQMLDVVEGRLEMAAARADIIASTRRYAKRQRTYFRNQFVDHVVHTISSPGEFPWAAVESFLSEDER